MFFWASGNPARKKIHNIACRKGGGGVLPQFFLFQQLWSTVHGILSTWILLLYWDIWKQGNRYMQEMHTISWAHSLSADITVYQLSSHFISWAHSLSAELTVNQLSSQLISWAHSLSAELTVYQLSSKFISWANSLSAELTVYQLSSKFISWAHGSSAELTVYQLSSQFISWAHSLSAELTVYQLVFLIFILYSIWQIHSAALCEAKSHAFICKYKKITFENSSYQ